MSKRASTGDVNPIGVIALFAVAFLCKTVHAQTLRIEPSVTASVTSTDNAKFSEASQAVTDVYAELMPRLNILWRAAHNRLSVNAGFDSVAYVHGSEPKRTVPVLRGEWVSTLVEHALFLDASARLGQQAASPYGAQAGLTASDAQVTTGEYRLSPHFRLNVAPEWLFVGRSDHLFTHLSTPVGSQTVLITDSAQAENTTLRLGRLPVPLGLGFELQHQRLNYRGDANVPVLGSDAARMLLAYAVNTEWMATFSGGAEHTSFSGQTNTDADIGLGLRWTPMPRSEWALDVRRRFFGNGFKATWVQRAAFWSAAVSAAREPVVNPGGAQVPSVDGLNAGDPEALSQAVSQSDPAQRAQLVNDTLDALGLPRQISEPINVYALYPQLSTGGAAIVSFTGRRTTLALNVFARQLQALRRAGDDASGPSTLPAGAGSDVRQYGAQAGLDLRMTPFTSITTTLRGSRARSLLNAADQSTDGWATVGVTHRLTPKTRLGMTVQHHRLNSTVLPSARANSVGASLNHSF
jgi:uncharacterized protein (PEP-CTERM system associated)